MQAISTGGGADGRAMRYASPMNPIRTARLRLVPATPASVRAELEDADGFCRLLGVRPVRDWPAAALHDVLPLFLRQLEEHPDDVGWLSWYWIREASRCLVGGGGFKGRPAVDGTVEIGYETRAAYRRQGYAKEGVEALVGWALHQEGVTRVIAETHCDNAASIAVLTASGFRRLGSGSEPHHLRFERARSDGADPS